MAKKKKNRRGWSGLDALAASLGTAVEKTNPGAMYQAALNADVEKLRIRQDPEVVKAKQETTRQTISEVGDYVALAHSSASEVGSGILGMFGVDVDSQSERDRKMVEAQAAAAAATIVDPATGTPPPPEDDPTLLYVGGAVAGVLLLGGLAYAASR